MIGNTEIIIMVTSNKLEILKKSIYYIRKNIDSKRICIISSKKNKSFIESLEGVHFIDEDKIINGLTIESVREMVEKRGGAKERAGWYYQQFLKLGWAYRCPYKYYLAIDADTFPLHKIDFIDEKGTYLFTQKIEYHKPYFESIDALFHGKLKKMVDFSFIAEHMAFDCEIVKEMIADIESGNKDRGKHFYEIILNAIDEKDISKSGFSEFETYGNYVIKNHPEIASNRKLRTCREAAVIIGGNPSCGQIEWAAEEFDIISIEDPTVHNIISKITSINFVRKYTKLSSWSKMRTKIRTVYRKVIKKDDLIFD